jgi:hypothetical protein
MLPKVLDCAHALHHRTEGRQAHLEEDYAQAKHVGLVAVARLSAPLSFEAAIRR